VIYYSAKYYSPGQSGEQDGSLVELCSASPSWRRLQRFGHLAPGRGFVPEGRFWSAACVTVAAIRCAYQAPHIHGLTRKSTSGRAECAA
jgi:hypothetical protein